MLEFPIAAIPHEISTIRKKWVVQKHFKFITNISSLKYIIFCVYMFQTACSWNLIIEVLQALQTAISFLFRIQFQRYQSASHFRC